MNSQARLLPRLDQLYLQKKSYQAHKKKLTSIRKSGSLSKRSLNQSSLHQNQQDVKSLQSLSQSALKLLQLQSGQKVCNQPAENRMETIQQAKPGLSYWLKKMNPLQKRIKQQQIKENKRIRQKIKNTMSFVQQSNKIDSHAQRYKGMKSMLNKFSIDHDSKKTKLKCEIVLKKITEIEKEKLKIQQSRILQLENKQRLTEKLLGLQKNNEILKKKIQQNQKETQSAKRTRLLSQKINLITKQSTSRMKNSSVLKNNFVQPQNNSILSRNRSELSSKTNSLIRNLKESKPFTPKLGNTEKYHRLKTDHLTRNESKRLFNSSKLSNLSSETAPQIANLKKEYKMLKVNFTHQGSSGFKRVLNSNTQKSLNKQKNTNLNVQNDKKNYRASRIRTQVIQNSRAISLKRQSSIKRFDYQKKRIERYIKSKSSLSVKDNIETNIEENSEARQNDNKTKKSIKQQKRPSIVEQKIEESMQTIEHAQKQQQKQNITKNQTKQEHQAAYFATEIQ